MAGRIRQEVLGVLLSFGAIFVSLSLATYNKWDPSLFTFTSDMPVNYGGRFGAYVADLMVTVLGLPSFLIPFFLFIYGVKRIFGLDKRVINLIGSALIVVAGCVFASLFYKAFNTGYGAGGMLGHLGSSFVMGLVGLAGAYVISMALLITGALLLTPKAIINFILKRQDEPMPEEETLEPSALRIGDEAVSQDELRELLIDEPDRGGELDVQYPEHRGEELLAVQPPLEVIKSARKGSADPDGEQVNIDKYKLPKLDMLNLYEHARLQSREELQASAALLESKLNDFNVKGKITHAHPGPVVTLCEFEPAPGIKITKVVNLADDMALALKAQSIRISAVPGKSSIGIEVPNPDREKVALREILASESFKNSASRLTIAMGKDIYGKPVVADLARMPHLLVAGATGSGKSVYMNSLVMSMLYKSTPAEVKMLMIDPKLLELSYYEGIPHLIAPVVTNPKDASEMLRRMVFEMERRYRLLADRGVRNIDSFNASCANYERLPYIVIFIDELADLMLASSAQVEDSIARLAQMARAAGIHLILATQRPSVDVITGVIKANFPARVAFQVTSKIDSRTILDAQGAEQLIGRGDMLFMLPGVKLLRVHGALVTEAEIKATVDFIKAQGSPDYSIIQAIAEAEVEARAEAKNDEERDEHFWKAVEYAEGTGEVSISSIQRKLKIGYNRAARIMELMEEDGMVGPQKGAGKPRDFVGRGGAA